MRLIEGLIVTPIKGRGSEAKPRVHAGGSTPPPNLPLKGEELQVAVVNT